MRRWLLSNTTYGTWLPGDPRGSVTSVRDARPEDSTTSFRFEHDLPGDPWEPPSPGLHEAATEQLKGPPIYLTLPYAESVLVQFQETCDYRRWTLYAAAIMYNHFHLVVGMIDDPSPKKVLADLKAYATRRLNREFGTPPSETWWTTNGSKRRIKDERHFHSALNYVLYKQP